MPVVLVTYVNGDPINATNLMGQLEQVRYYVNEQIAQGDRASAWMEPQHIYRPDFYGGSNPHTTLVTGESYFRSRPLAEERRAFFSWRLGDGPYPVPGLNATIQIPETLDPLVGRYRLVVTASFYAYEFGGDDNYIQEVNPFEAATFDIAINGVIARSSSTTRTIYKGSRTAADQAVPYYSRKQVSMIYGDTSSPIVGVGCNSVGVVVNPVSSPSDIVKHVVIAQGNLVARYFLR